MKNYLRFLAVALLVLPVFAQAAITVPWNATSTEKGYITPNLVNGNSPWLVVSGTGTSTFSGPIRSTCFSTNGTSCISGGTTYTATFPISISGSVISFLGLSTSTAAVVGNIPYFSAANTFANVATTSATINNGLTGLLTTINSGGTQTIGLATIAANSVLGNITGSIAVPGAIATSSLFLNASASNTGLLTSTDWSTFNGKQAAGNYITALTGDITASGPGSAAATLATVNGNVGSFTNANITVNAKGLITAAANGSSSGSGTISTSTNLVSGQVDFSTGASTIGNDSGFFWDNTNKRLGIGTITPSLPVTAYRTLSAPSGGLSGVAQFTAENTSNIGTADFGPVNVFGMKDPLSTAPTNIGDMGFVSNTINGTTTGKFIVRAYYQGAPFTSGQYSNAFVYDAQTGDFAVGTTTPSSVLCDTDSICVYDNTFARIRMTASSTTGHIVQGFFDARSDAPATQRFQFGTKSNDPLAFLTNDNVRMTVSTKGFLGIGTATPAWVLQVSTTSATTAFVPQFAISDQNGGTDLKHLTFTYQKGTFYLATSSDALATSSIAALTMNSSGNFGIASTSPTQKLSVNGGGWFSGSSFHVGPIADNLLGGPCTADATVCSELVGSDNTTGGVTQIIENTNAGTSAYSDLFFANDNTMSGGVITNYAVLNFNSHAYADTTFGTAFAIPDQFALYNVAGPTLIGSTPASGYVNFLVGGAAASNEIARFTSTSLGIATTSPHAVIAANAGNTQATRNLLELSYSTGATNSSTTTVLTVASSSAPTLGVGTTSPWRSLSVTGTVGFDGLTAVSATQAGALCLSASKEVTNDSVACVVSSQRYKQDIQALSTKDALTQTLKLTPVSFYYKPDFNGALQTDPNFNGEQVGFIAEDVQKVNPDLIVVDNSSVTFEGKTTPAGTPQSVRYQNLTAILAGAIQEQQKEIDGIASSAESNWQWFAIGLLVLWNLYLTFRRRK